MVCVKRVKTSCEPCAIVSGDDRVDAFVCKEFVWTVYLNGERDSSFM